MIKTIADSFPCIVIYRPRQAGKSTTVGHIFGDRYRVVTPDDIEDLLPAENNPRLFLKPNGCPLVIDEIRKVPGLLNEIKKKIDAQKLQRLKDDKSPELMYVLAGSGRFDLQQRI